MVYRVGSWDWTTDRRRFSGFVEVGHNDFAGVNSGLESGCRHRVFVSGRNSDDAGSGRMEDIQSVSSSHSGRTGGKLGDGDAGFYRSGSSVVCGGKMALRLRANTYVHPLRMVPDSPRDCDWDFAATVKAGRAVPSAPPELAKRTPFCPIEWWGQHALPFVICFRLRMSLGTALHCCGAGMKIFWPTRIFSG